MYNYAFYTFRVAYTFETQWQSPPIRAWLPILVIHIVYVELLGRKIKNTCFTAVSTLSRKVLKIVSFQHTEKETESHIFMVSLGRCLKVTFGEGDFQIFQKGFTAWSTLMGILFDSPCIWERHCPSIVELILFKLL